MGYRVNSWMAWLELAGMSRFFRNEDIPSYGWGKAMVIHKPLKNAGLISGRGRVRGVG